MFFLSSLVGDRVSPSGAGADSLLQPPEPVQLLSLRLMAACDNCRNIEQSVAQLVAVAVQCSGGLRWAGHSCNDYFLED